MAQRWKNGLAGLAALTGLLAGSTALSQTEPFIGQIRTFGFDFCPLRWAPAAGQLLPISQNTALFSLLSTRYGGDGTSTFALPDLRGRIVVGPGQGPGLSSYANGQAGGAETAILGLNELPSHAHGVAGLGAPPSVQVRTAKRGEVATGRSTAAGATLSTQSVGGGQPHENRQPYLAMTTCIALLGIFPSRPE